MKLLVAALLFGACAAHPKIARLQGNQASSIHRFLAGQTFEYIVDVNVQACFLAYIGGMSEISCEKLKGTVPQAGAVITWLKAPAEVP